MADQELHVEAVRAAARAAIRDLPTVDSVGRELSSGIQGVEVQRLVTHADHRGMLTPVIDVRSAFWDEPIVYAYRMGILPGRIKGWGMHERQTDRLRDVPPAAQHDGPSLTVATKSGL